MLDYFDVDGEFGAYMQVRIENDGPVTICLESPSAPMNAKQVFFPYSGYYISWAIRYGLKSKSQYFHVNDK